MNFLPFIKKTTMNTPKKNQESDDLTESQADDVSIGNDAVEDDGTPVLDEADLAENNLTVDDAEDIIWDPAPEDEESED
jgi:hypothetical protein